MGENFNVTKAGIHADGLLKNEEIYNIFDSKKFLKRPPLVSLNQNSGAAGVALWINESYGLEGEHRDGKHSPVVKYVKSWIDEQYANGRMSIISGKEVDKKIDEFIASDMGTEGEQ